MFARVLLGRSLFSRLGGRSGAALAAHNLRLVGRVSDPDDGGQAGKAVQDGLDLFSGQPMRRSRDRSERGLGLAALGLGLVDPVRDLLQITTRVDRSPVADPSWRRSRRSSGAWSRRGCPPSGSVYGVAIASMVGSMRCGANSPAVPPSCGAGSVSRLTCLTQVLCSTARRARQTWQLAQAKVRAQPPVRFDGASAWRQPQSCWS